MLISFIKVTLRKLFREKLYTIINVSGLALGIACCLILGLFLHSELTYDQHNKNYKRIYRVAAANTINGTEWKLALTSDALPSLLKKENPDVKDYVRFAITNSPTTGDGIPFYYGDDTYYWHNVFVVDDNVFEVFTYNIIYGDPKTALVDPSSIAVSETFAKKYFGDENPIGKTVRNNVTSFKISLVFANLPANTHLKTDVLMSYNTPVMRLDPSNLRQDLWNAAGYNYLVLPEDYPQDSFKKITNTLYQKYMKEIGDGSNQRMDFWLQPLKDIHYRSDVGFDEPTGNALYLYTSVAVGLLILLVACINYMNLATARSLKRGREVGIHRVMGANKSQLTIQFLGESIVITIMALFLGMIIVELVLALTSINELVGNLQLTDYVLKPVLLCWLIGSTIFTGVVSGLYPAFYLSSISPLAAITVLKKAAASRFKMRQILVLIQFIISIGVIACTFLMISQMRYIANKPLGFAKENRVVIRLEGADVNEKHKLIKIELLKNPNVLGMTICMGLPGDELMCPPKRVEKNDGSMVLLPMVWLPAFDDDYLHVMGMKLLEGRNFSKEISADLNKAAIVNETFVKKMGWDNPLGKRIEDGGDNTKYKVIGVMKDFHFKSLHSTVEPVMLIRYDYDASSLTPQQRISDYRMMVISISGKEIPQTINYIKNAMGKIDPKHIIRYEFLDKIIDRFYVFENQLVKLTSVFACICVFISCLGLFGLSAFTTEQRSKEIGVRKVVGASTMQIILMLFKPTVILVLIGAVIASASAYLVMEKWLAGFAYKADINPLMFVMATLIVIIVAFVTIALQSLKTAHANPVEALRYE